jgi:hypothetical protein
MTNSAASVSNQPTREKKTNAKQTFGRSSMSSGWTPENAERGKRS